MYTHISRIRTILKRLAKKLQPAALAPYEQVIAKAAKEGEHEYVRHAADEVLAATAWLATLDANGDGKLGRRELRKLRDMQSSEDAS